MAALDTILGNDVITAYPWPVAPAQLMHVYSPRRSNSKGEPYDFDRIFSLLESLRIEHEEKYLRETGRPFRPMEVSEEEAQKAREYFWLDSRFKEVFPLFDLDYDKDHQKAITPWWNEIAAGELDHRLCSEMHEVEIVVGPRHSLETQLMREGVKRPVKNISVGGLIVTAPEEDSSFGSVIVGLRGGRSYRNTYHINCGALMATTAFQQGMETVYDIFRQKELLPEFGIADRDVVSAHLNSRIYDHVIDKGPMYVFVVKTRLTKRELHERWEANLDPDKAEHDEPIYISDNPSAVQAFIRENYRGVVANRARADHERYLLHPGALALAAYSGMPASALRPLFREGNW